MTWKGAKASIEKQTFYGEDKACAKRHPISEAIDGPAHCLVMLWGIRWRRSIGAKTGEVSGELGLICKEGPLILF